MKKLAQPRRHVSSPERAGGTIFFRSTKPDSSTTIEILTVVLVVLGRIPSPQSG